MGTNPPKVLNVGQCDLDHGNISRMLSEDFSAVVDQAATCEQACCAVRDGDYDLVLVNRVLDADGTSGLDLIQRLRSDEHTGGARVALVSNFAEAQEQAVALGAERGFGKDALTSPATRERLASLLGK